MDKKKVIELIGNVEKYLLAYEKSGKNADIAMAFQQLHEAQDEVQKPDWISIEDELPKYGEEVLVCNKKDPSSISLTYRVNHRGMDIDRHGFHWESCLKPITHWHKIDKLEV